MHVVVELGVDRAYEEIAKCQPVLEYLQELIRDVATNERRRRGATSLEVMELPGLSGIGDLFTDDEPTYRPSQPTYRPTQPNELPPILGKRKRPHGQELGLPRPRPRCPYAAQTIWYATKDLFTMGSIRKMGYATRSDYDNYLRGMWEYDPRYLDPEAEGPRPDLPHPRPLNVPLWKKLFYSIRDVFPQNLMDCRTRAEFDDFLRRVRDPDFIKRELEMVARCDEIDRKTALAQYRVNYHFQHYRIDGIVPDEYGTCQACEYQMQTGKEYIPPKVVQPQATAYNAVQAPSNSEGTRSRNSGLALHPFGGDGCVSRVDSTNNQIFADAGQPIVDNVSECDKRIERYHKLLSAFESIMLQVQEAERVLERQEQDAREMLDPASHKQACEVANNIRDYVIYLLREVEMLRDPHLSADVRHLLLEWLERPGPNGTSRKRFLANPMVPEMAIHTASASTSEIETTKRQKLSSGDHQWARKSDPLPTSNQDLTQILQPLPTPDFAPNPT